jgi:glycosyltransferase involved in cell wall biosynthesis
MKLVIQNTSLVWGGNEKWLSIVSTGLMAKGHDVIVSCADGPVKENLERLGVPVTAHRPRGAIDIFSALDFAAFLRRAKPDSLLLTSWRPTTWCVIAARWAGVHRIVMRLGIVRPFPDGGPRARAIKAVDALIVNSDEIRSKWLSTIPAGIEQDVHVVLNSIALPDADPVTLRKRLRDEFEVSNETLVIGAAGHLATRKGFDLLIDAFHRANIPAARLLIIGEGEHRAQLESMIRELHISDRVTLAGARDSAADLIGGLDLFVLSSHNEGMANVMLEAMAARVPILAAEISGVEKAIGDGEGGLAAGWTFTPGSVDSLARQLVEVTQMIRARSRDVGARVTEARWRIENWFSISRMIDECEEIIFSR